MEFCLRENSKLENDRNTSLLDAQYFMEVKVNFGNSVTKFKIVNIKCKLNKRKLRKELASKKS